MSFNSGIKKYEIGQGSRSLHIEVCQGVNDKYFVSVAYTSPSTTIAGNQCSINVGWMLINTFTHPHTARLTGHQALYDELTARGLYKEFKQLLGELQVIINYKNIFNE